MEKKIDKGLSEMTLREIYENYADEMRREFPWNDSTCKEYEYNFLKILAPQLNEKPFADYVMSDFDAALDRIRESGYDADKKSRKIRYSEGSINTFRANLRRLDEFLVIKGIKRISLFWGTKYDINASLTEEQTREKERTQLRKSLTPLEEKKVYEKVMNNPEQDGEFFGVALMVAFGLRNSEACAVNFSNVVPMDDHPDCYVLQVYQNIKAGEKNITVGGKTKNVFRLIPIPDKFYALIKKREEYIRSQYSGDKKISDLTIACVGQNFEKNCEPDIINETAKYVLYKADLDPFVLGQIEKNIEYDDKVTEKKPTAYLFRRHFGTMLYMLGLSQEEIEYLMGHQIKSIIDNRNSFSNPDKLYPIKRKMDNRPLFSSHRSLLDPIETLLGKTIHFDNPYEQKIIIPKGTAPCTITVTVRADKPGEDINFAIKSASGNDAVNYYVHSSMTQRNESRVSGILKDVHHVYDSKRGKKTTDNTVNNK